MSNNVTKYAYFILIIAGINTGLIGLLNLDLFATLMGATPTALKATDLLIGLSAIFALLQSLKSPTSS